MKIFLFKIGAFFVLMIGSYFLLIHALSKGAVDEYYNKFTYPAEGIIVGLSRADQGIVPSILSESFNDRESSFKMVNFAMNQSFYGEVYLNAIKNKLKKNIQNGIFILSVNPGCFTAPRGLDEKEILKLDEKTILGKLSLVTEAPNYDYLTCCYGSSLYNVFYNTSVWTNIVFHGDGWNEVVLETPKNIISEADIHHWTNLNLRFYKQKLQTEEFKQYRLDYFIKTLLYLQDQGKVYMVRMPADTGIIALENEEWKQFDKLMDSIAIAERIPYFNFSTKAENYKTYDGSHLESQSARKFTQDLVDQIKALY